jgi:hypothetical protein
MSSDLILKMKRCEQRAREICVVNGEMDLLPPA